MNPAYIRINTVSHYSSLTPLQQFLTFMFTNQREREAIKDERTHYGAVAMDKY